MTEDKNMELYNFLCTPPNGALKPIDYGPLKGKSDINPQWRYEALTQKLGPCGVGWKFTVDNYFTQEVPQTGEMMLFVMITLYISQGDKWSDGIPAYGGDFLIKKDKNGIHGNDEAMKMAITDALGTAMKYIGVAADVYRGLLNGVKVGADTKYAKYAEIYQDAPQTAKNTSRSKSTTTATKTQNKANDGVKAQAINKCLSEAKRLNLTQATIGSIASKHYSANGWIDMTAEQITEMAENLENWSNEK